MEQNLEQTTSLLSRTPAALGALLRDLPSSWTARNEGEGTWNAANVIGHLIDGERVNWLPRAKYILEFGETKPFAPFDREAHLRLSQNSSLNDLLDEFAKARAQNLSELSSWNLTPQQLSSRGQHPAFGTVTLSQLLAAWATHDLTHMHQISRIMAYQYNDAVGPWRKYLGVLHCTGHGSD